ncbi:cytochrome b [Ostreibacterium oceani]|uniref:Cytochrome b n=1 Tax=Ostreibacterium oceani TaxID=2654998 RepID=A0A6N7F489_9GAMM|nr:cytochrome bc complex cytochrome b subunit [Ostreibacterium oceani]MPV86696.1 cytochrome b [Ostreibacterium oceani]
MQKNETTQNNVVGWIDKRFPLTKMWNEHLAEYYAPKNFNFFYYFGSLALLVLVNQIVSGIWLAMFYKPDTALAFASVEGIMRDVPFGYLIRYMHSTGASAFFVVVYLHMFRALIYGSYKKPRELVWIFGMLIFLCLMAEAFMGYLLPWGQMSYWGANVIISLFSAIPFLGEFVVQFIQGDYYISDATLNRFFSLHVILLPLVLVMLVAAHIIALHEVGSNNPDGVEIKANKDENGIPRDGIPFHPYYTVKDLFGVGVFLIIFCAIMFYAPEMGGYFLEHPNFEPANPVATPDHIAPVWYFGSFYSILRAATFGLDWVFFAGLGAALLLFGVYRLTQKQSIKATGVVLGLAVLMFIAAATGVEVSAKQLGVILMFGAIILLFVLPWLDTEPTKSIRYRGPIFKVTTALFVIGFLLLTWLGGKEATGPALLTAQILTLYYFVYLLVILPILPKIDRCKPVPERVTK